MDGNLNIAKFLIFIELLIVVFIIVVLIVIFVLFFIIVILILIIQIIFIIVFLIFDGLQFQLLGPRGCQGLLLLQSLFLSIFGEWAADKFHSRENVNSARQKHGKALDFHTTLLAGRRGRSVPLVKIPTFGLVVNVVKEAMLGH